MREDYGKIGFTDTSLPPAGPTNNSTLTKPPTAEPTLQSHNNKYSNNNKK